VSPVARVHGNAAAAALLVRHPEHNGATALRFRSCCFRVR
jgi:hypothetical protein